MKIIGISPHRRHFLRKAVGAAPAVALLAGAGGGLAMAVSKDQPAYKPRFFDATEWATLTALVDRLIPADGEGPGALESGAHEFIDAQMNTPYAYGALWYMQGPFVPSIEQFGYQFHMAPRELYKSALAGVNAAVNKQSGKPFVQLNAAERDAVITQLQKGSLDIGEVPAKVFFNQLLQNTREGYFCDPVHGGNKDMLAWKMVGFPGARADYMDWVEQYGKKYPLPPVSIA